MAKPTPQMLPAPGKGFLRIGDVAQLVGVSPSVLRSWESLGLVRPRRARNGYRGYTAEQVKLLKRARFLRRVRGLNAPAIVHLLKSQGLLRSTPAHASGTIGPRLRSLRLKRSLSLAKVAASVGASIGFLSSLERGQMTASIATLRKLARFYGIQILALFNPSEDNPRLVRPSQRKLLEAGPGVRMELLAWGNAVLEPHLFRIASGAGSGEAYAHEGEEFLFSIRLARQITGRPKILVFNWCYHGSVDETFTTLKDGVSKARRGNIGPPVDPSVTTKVVEFNDLEALERALDPRDVACVLAEPVMTNVGIVHPDLGYHRNLRELTRRFGTLLIIDETHTICAGPGGYTCAENLEPDFLVFGKPIGGGVPGATYGFPHEVARSTAKHHNLEDCDTGGIGGTLAGNALSMVAMRATLEKVLTKESFDQMIPMAGRWTAGVEKAIGDFSVPWHVTRLGCRAEYLFSPHRPRNGTEAHDAMDFELERFMHLYAMNRDILLTPFHNMALMSPVTTTGDIDQHTRVFRDALRELAG